MAVPESPGAGGTNTSSNWPPARILPMPTQFIATPPPTHSCPDPGHGLRAAGQVDHHLLGALLQRCREIRVDLGDLLVRVARRAGGGDESRGDTRPAMAEDPQREQGRVEREPGGRQRDRAGEQGAEPCRVAECGQGHDGAFFVAAPPAQVRGDGTVGVPERCGIADRLDDPVPYVATRASAGGADGGRAGFAEAVDDQDRCLARSPTRRTRTCREPGDAGRSAPGRSGRGLSVSSCAAGTGGG